MPDQQASRWITRYLVYLIGLAWVGLGLVTAYGLHPALPASPGYRWGLGGLAFLIGTALVALYRLIRNQRAVLYYSFVGILSLISVSFIFDEVGWIDVSAFLLHLFLILLVVRDREVYLPGTASEG